MFNERPQTEGVGYYVGLIRYRKKDYQGALKAFRAETSKNPNIQQLVQVLLRAHPRHPGAPRAGGGGGRRGAAVPDRLRAHRPGGANPGLPGRREGHRAAVARRGPRGLPLRQQRGGEPQPSHDPPRSRSAATRRPPPARSSAARLEYTWLRTGPWESSVAYSFFQTSTTGGAAGLQRAEPSGVGGPVLQGGRRRDALPGRAPSTPGTTSRSAATISSSGRPPRSSVPWWRTRAT